MREQEENFQVPTNDFQQGAARSLAESAIFYIFTCEICEVSVQQQQLRPEGVGRRQIGEV